MLESPKIKTPGTHSQLRFGALLLTAVVSLGFGVPWVGRELSPVLLKASGQAPKCPWHGILDMPSYARDIDANVTAYYRSLVLVASDSKLPIEQYAAKDGRRYWIRRDGSKMPGKMLLAYLLADHEIISKQNPNHSVQPGDVVLDCGAHIGTFTKIALDRGASKVVSIEPDPINRECLRRNFAAEIAKGSVVVVSDGVWSSNTDLTLHIAVENSGMSSVVTDQKGSSVTIHVVRIDDLVKDLGLARVDFIKMDIEGAEREALKGGIQTLKQFRPRLMLDAYHLPDDMMVLPAIIQKADSRYVEYCGPCEKIDRDEIVPHMIFFQSPG